MAEVTFKRGKEDLFATLYGDWTVGVVLCPPHPLYGGNRYDVRLVKIARELVKQEISALSIDYKRYAGGEEEAKDVLAALTYMSQKVKALGLLGYSYGTLIASEAAIQSPVKIKGLALLSPLEKINDLEINLSSDCPKLLVCGRGDDFAIKDFEKLYLQAEGEKEKLILDTDHFYTGRGVIEQVSKKVAEFFSRVLKD